MINFIKKYCYSIIPIITIIIYLICDFLKHNSINSLEFDISTIIQMSGTLIGFLLTAISIFATIPKNTDYMRRFELHQHKKIFSRCIGLGIILLAICIFLWLMKTKSIYVVLTFILGFEETLFSAYYLYRMCFDNR